MCEFPALTLLRLNRKTIRDLEASDDEAKIRIACDFNLHLQRLRMAHEELTGCRCWWEAYKQEGPVLSKPKEAA